MQSFPIASCRIVAGSNARARNYRLALSLRLLARSTGGQDEGRPQLNCGVRSAIAIWAIAHDERRRFDAEDLRLLESMGRFASAAYQAVESIENLR